MWWLVWGFFLVRKNQDPLCHKLPKGRNLTYEETSLTKRPVEVQAQCNKGITKDTFQIKAAVQIFLFLSSQSCKTFPTPRGSKE